MTRRVMTHDGRVRLSVVRSLPVTAPLLETSTHWFTHGFGADLDAAMRNAAERAVQLLVDLGGFSADEAYSVASVAVDVGVTRWSTGRSAATPRSRGRSWRRSWPDRRTHSAVGTTD